MTKLQVCMVIALAMFYIINGDTVPCVVIQKSATDVAESKSGTDVGPLVIVSLVIGLIGMSFISLCGIFYCIHR